MDSVVVRVQPVPTTQPAADVESLLAAAQVNRGDHAGHRGAQQEGPGPLPGELADLLDQVTGSWSLRKVETSRALLASIPVRSAANPELLLDCLMPSRSSPNRRRVHQPVPLSHRLIVDLSLQLADQITGLRANLRGHLLCLTLRHGDPASFLGAVPAACCTVPPSPPRRRRRAGTRSPTHQRRERLRHGPAHQRRRAQWISSASWPPARGGRPVDITTRPAHAWPRPRLLVIRITSPGDGRRRLCAETVSRHVT